MMIPIKKSMKLINSLIFLIKIFIFRKEKCSHVTKWDIYQVLKKNQFSYKNIEKLQEYLKKISIQQV